MWKYLASLSLFSTRSPWLYSCISSCPTYLGREKSFWIVSQELLCISLREQMFQLLLAILHSVSASLSVFSRCREPTKTDQSRVNWHRLSLRSYFRVWVTFLYDHISSFESLSCWWRIVRACRRESCLSCACMVLQMSSLGNRGASFVGGGRPLLHLLTRSMCNSCSRAWKALSWLQLNRRPSLSFHFLHLPISSHAPVWRTFGMLWIEVLRSVHPACSITRCPSSPLGTYRKFAEPYLRSCRCALDSRWQTHLFDTIFLLQDCQCLLALSWTFSCRKSHVIGQSNFRRILLGCECRFSGDQRSQSWFRTIRHNACILVFLLIFPFASSCELY